MQSSDENQINAEVKFNYKGPLNYSKSWLNRLLILQSYNSQIKFDIDSKSDDVIYLKKSLDDFADGKNQYYVGLGGTSLRFLALRVSRKSGTYVIKADPQLFKRPQQELVHVLSQLSVECQIVLKNSELHIHSKGWSLNQPFLEVQSHNSSQFLSSVFLNSVDLDFDLPIQFNQPEMISESYFNYTQSLLQNFGFQWQTQNQFQIIKKNQKLKLNFDKDKVKSEIDVSSAFTIAAAAVLSGQLELTNWNTQSVQPDMAFLNFFKKMNIKYIETSGSLVISQQSHYLALSADLKNCPDLFPVLAVLCAFANGKSEFSGAHHLKFKESDRIEKTFELLTRCGFEVQKKHDGMIVIGCPGHRYIKRDLIIFDTDHDHRMAFAAALLKLKGFPIQIINPDVIKKSYPDFYQHIGLQK